MKIVEMQYYILNPKARSLFSRDKYLTESAMETGRKDGIKAGMETGMKAGRKEGMKAGIVKGENKKLMEIAKTMLEENFTLKEISKVTKLSSKEIKALM